MAEYVYSASGNPVVKKIGGNVTSTYAYDELLNIKALKTEAGKQALADNHYFYDGNGNQIRKEGLEGTTGYAYGTCRGSGGITLYKRVLGSDQPLRRRRSAP